MNRLDYWMYDTARKCGAQKFVGNKERSQVFLLNPCERNLLAATALA